MFRPLSDRLLVKPDAADKMTSGGIHIPDTAQDKVTRGAIVAVGRGAIVDGRIIEPQLKAGDRVVYGKYAGTELRIDGADHVVLREDDVLGVVE